MVIGAFTRMKFWHLQMKSFHITYCTSGYSDTFEGSHWATSDLANTYFGNFSGKKNHFLFIQNSPPLLIVALGLTFATKKITNPNQVLRKSAKFTDGEQLTIPGECVWISSVYPLAPTFQLESSRDFQDEVVDSLL